MPANDWLHFLLLVAKSQQSRHAFTRALFSFWSFSSFLVLICIWLKPQKLKLTKLVWRGTLAVQLKREIGLGSLRWFFSLTFGSLGSWSGLSEMPQRASCRFQDGHFCCWISKEVSWSSVGSVSISGDDPWISEASSKPTVIILAPHIIKCIGQWRSKVQAWLPATVMPQSRMTDTVMIIRLFASASEDRIHLKQSENWICP